MKAKKIVKVWGGKRARRFFYWIRKYGKMVDVIDGFRPYDNENPAYVYQYKGRYYIVIFEANYIPHYDETGAEIVWKGVDTIIGPFKTPEEAERYYWSTGEEYEHVVLND